MHISFEWQYRYEDVLERLNSFWCANYKQTGEEYAMFISRLTIQGQFTR